MMDRYLYVGKGKWTGAWVSKQQIVEYARCPYRVYLSVSKGIPIQDLKEMELLRAILERGLETESEIVMKVKPVRAQTVDEVEPLGREKILIQVPTIVRNRELGIQGIPDLIDTDNGTFLPLEIKSHREVSKTDELELAFYWLLLEPLRTRRAKPRGAVILGDGEIAQVNLSKDHFMLVQYYIDHLRTISQRHWLRPTLSQECRLCRLKQECHEELVKSGGLSVIHNISYGRQNQLKAIGIDNVAKLTKIDPEDVHDKLVHRFANSPGPDELFRMKCHALAYKNDKPIFFGRRDQIDELRSSPVLAFDLEYDAESLIWMVGIAIKDKRGIVYRQFFAERRSLDEEERILEEFSRVVRKHRSHPLVSYSGISADMPQLRNANIRKTLGNDDLAIMESNHIDLCDVLKQSFRFPAKSFSLDSMEQYLGIDRQSNISSGLEALGVYQAYLRTKTVSRKEKLKKELMDYNREDVQSTLQIIERMPEWLEKSVTRER